MNKEVKYKRYRKCVECGKPSYGRRGMDCYHKDKGKSLSKFYVRKRRRKK